MTTVPARRRRRWPFVLGIGGLVVWVAALIAGIVVLAATAPGTLGGVRRWDEETIQGDGDGKVAMVRIEGEILPGEGSEGLFSVSFGADDYVSQLRQALEDDDVDAVILRLDTPGGAVVASDQVFRMVRELGGRKPVIASMGDVAASGGYYIAAAAEKVIANPSTITGSIGVIAVFLNLEGTASKVGAKPVVIKSGPHKDIGSPFREMTPAERKIVQRLIDEAFEQFVDAVAEGRGLSEQAVRRIADGRVLSGRQAKAAGLVDELGDLDDAFRIARDEAGIDEARLVVYRRPAPGFFSPFLFGRLGIGKEIRSAVRDVGADIVGVPTRPGLHYLWIQ